ncbi:hypothetical protein [Martelella radicis]|uniref:Uncharacterized protein n=1 Tax=Martelella radicis TaxID=1397476 RepID=A0A7W6PAF2_9HYPH|nr:hypothetical protein [Martelella radicis]MBB4123277.1 hypothetical protein [Martelella radicis]
MSKRDDFLFAVQTAILADCILRQSKKDPTSKEKTFSHPAHIIGRMDDLLYAADRIPEHMTAFEAAHSYCFYMIDSLREDDERSSGREAELPSWFARY